MSQRIFEQKGKQVVAGWDRPLQYLFVDIYEKDPVVPREDRLVFDNLARPNGPRMTLDEIKATIERFGLTAPASYYDDLARDERLDVGNLEKHYGEDRR